LRVATGAPPLVARHKVPEPADLDLLTAAECLFDKVEHKVDVVRQLFFRKSANSSVQRLNDFGLRHDRCLPSSIVEVK